MARRDGFTMRGRALFNRGFYQVLGLSPDATEQEIKKAYRRLAQTYHPDKNSGDKLCEEKFKEIKEAYDTLKDPSKRNRYDRTFWGKFGGGNGMPYSNGAYSARSNPISELFNDILEDLLSGKSKNRRSSPKRGADIYCDLHLSFLDSYTGRTTQIHIQRMETCSYCFGTGARRGTKTIPCSTCNGEGRIGVEKGHFRLFKACIQCEGAGKIVRNPCSTCSGSGKVRREREVTVTVPPGISHGTRLKLSGEGEVGSRNGPVGDIYIQIQVEKHPIFNREENHVVFDLPISFSQATLGCSLEIPTLTGSIRMAIPPGTQSNQVFRIPRRGFPHPGEERPGDQLVRVIVETPINLNETQRRIIEEFAAMSGVNIHPRKQSFFSKMRNLFGTGPSL